MAAEIIMYSTGCPKCNVLKTKLTSKGIEFKENNSTEDMLALGITFVPVLSVDGELLQFSEALAWVNKQ